MIAPKSDNDPIPVMAGELQEETDGQSKYSVVDVIFNPVVTKGVSNSKDCKNLLVHVALDYIESTKKVQVSRKYRNSKKPYKGDPKNLRKYLRHGRDQGIKATNPEQQKSGVSENPESLLKQLSSIAMSESQSDRNVPLDLFERSPEKPKKHLIEEVSSTNIAPQPTTPTYEVLLKDAENSKPKRIIMKVILPNIALSSQCQLDACEVCKYNIYSVPDLSTFLIWPEVLSWFFVMSHILLTKTGTFSFFSGKKYGLIKKMNLTFLF